MIAAVSLIPLDLPGVSVSISPDEGGRVAGLRVGDRALLVGPDGRRDLPLSWGSYPMVPWVGRTRHACFAFDGEDYTLPVNFEPHSIHGTGWSKPWRVTRNSSLAVELEVDLSDDDRSDWPFGGIARQRFELEPTSLTCWIEVHSDRPMPADVGWHPWFTKPDEVDFRAGLIYPRDDDYIPLREGVPATPPPWDDCFSEVTQPVGVRWGDLRLEITSSCAYWVVYDMPDYGTCVEPQSGPSNSLNSGPSIVEPDSPLIHWMRLGWA